jgi:DNA-binding XRE family transcriptional regulator
MTRTTRTRTETTRDDQMTQPPTARPWTTVLDGRRLQNLRHEHGLSREELAGRAGISEYRAAMFAFTTEADPQRHGSTR